MHRAAQWWQTNVTYFLNLWAFCFLFVGTMWTIHVRLHQSATIAHVSIGGSFSGSSTWNSLLALSRRQTWRLILYVRANLWHQDPVLPSRDTKRHSPSSYLPRKLTNAGTTSGPVHVVLDGTPQQLRHEMSWREWSRLLINSWFHSSSSLELK